MEQTSHNEINQSIKQSKCSLKNIFLFLFLLITVSILTGVIVYAWQSKIFSLQQQLSTITNELNKTKQINNELQQTIKIDSILSPNSNYEVYLEKNTTMILSATSDKVLFY